MPLSFPEGVRSAPAGSLGDSRQEVWAAVRPLPAPKREGEGSFPGEAKALSWLPLSTASSLGSSRPFSMDPVQPCKEASRPDQALLPRTQDETARLGAPRLVLSVPRIWAVTLDTSPQELPSLCVLSSDERLSPENSEGQVGGPSPRGAACFSEKSARCASPWPGGDAGGPLFPWDGEAACTLHVFSHPPGGPTPPFPSSL